MTAVQQRGLVILLLVFVVYVVWSLFWRTV